MTILIEELQKSNLFDLSDFSYNIFTEELEFNYPFMKIDYRLPNLFEVTEYILNRRFDYASALRFKKHTYRQK